MSWSSRQFSTSFYYYNMLSSWQGGETRVRRIHPVVQYHHRCAGDFGLPSYAIDGGSAAGRRILHISMRRALRLSEPSFFRPFVYFFGSSSYSTTFETFRGLIFFRDWRRQDFHTTFDFHFLCGFAPAKLRLDKKGFFNSFFNSFFDRFQADF